ncbi:hypothetical protein [Phreatobacter sp. AB_2022a]|uniref:hypothetical protein n=1 Tax=Phreatobacter sp. AB_2022a TaxID=3003134 RepID=UPI002286E515|nr:hypothetical protein [Phreatobacter sp. AB_2022a]MCZ0733061.1 hypothetical protein [Phreatobacter sp. AB_2022a]
MSGKRSVALVDDERLLAALNEARRECLRALDVLPLHGADYRTVEGVAAAIEDLAGILAGAQGFSAPAHQRRAGGAR